MLTLGSTNTLCGKANNDDIVSYTVAGMELSNGVENYKILSQGFLNSSGSILYTTPANTTTFIKNLALVNSSGGIVSGIKIFINGLDDINQISSTFGLSSHGSATYDQTGWKVYNDSGEQVIYTTDVGIYGNEYLKIIDYTDINVLNKVKNVDGSGSGLDADLLDGLHASELTNHNLLNNLQGGASGQYYHLDSSGYTNSHSPFVLGTKIVSEAGIGDNKILSYNATSGIIQYATFSSTHALTADDADKLDGQHGSYYMSYSIAMAVALG